MKTDFSPFFIVGAPRCGTTAMSRYLGKHPNICFSDPKETHYFLFADHAKGSDALRKEFLSAYFPNLSDVTRVVGDGSISTLYSKDALQLILRVFEAPKFIVMLRNPVDMLRSYHARVLHLRQENEADLETAWAIQDQRAKGVRIPKSCSDPRVLQYRDIARLGFHSAQMVETVGAENCLPLFFDDFMSDTLGTYQKTLEFLDLPYDGRAKFRRKNAARTYKNGFLQSLYSGPVMRPVANQFMKNPVRAARIQRALRPYRKKMKKANSLEANPASLDPVFAAELRDYFAEDVRELGQLFGRDLEHWTKADPVGVAPAV